jgi:hypothetical protein
MHECPECYDSCYCGGDIDDILMSGTREERQCGHCPEEPEQSCDYVCPNPECAHCSCAHERTGIEQPNCIECSCDGSALRKEQQEARGED